jgi:hypothetical protein
MFPWTGKTIEREVGRAKDLSAPWYLPPDFRVKIAAFSHGMQFWFQCEFRNKQHEKSGVGQTECPVVVFRGFSQL